LIYSCQLLDFCSTTLAPALLEGRILLFLFDNFILDVDRRELRRDRVVIPLQPQVFDLLEYLIRDRDRVVTRDDLIAAVWGGRIVSESTLATRINAARTAIGDSGEAQELIRTLPRKGFRFVGIVREAEKPESPIAALGIETPSDPASIAVDHERSERIEPAVAIGGHGGGLGRAGRWAARNVRPLTIALALLVAFASAALAAQYFYSRGKENQIAFPVLAPIGVLPFEPLGASIETTAVAALLSDDLVNALARVPSLQVISRLAARQNGGRPKDVTTIGNELGVRYLLDGTVRIEDDKLHLNVELIDTNSGLQVWSNRFERSPAESDIVRREIVRGLCRSLQVEMINLNNRLVPTPAGQPRKNDELLALGWSAVYGSSAADTFPQAEASFREVLRRNPEQTSAMLGLAAHHVIAVGNFVVPEREPYLGEAEDLLNHVLIQQPELSPAYYYRGFVQKLRGELVPALTSFERSIDLNPSFIPAYGQVGQVLTSLGRAAEGLEQIRYAMRVSPQDPIMPSWNIFAGEAEFELGHDAEGLEWLLRAIALSPNSRLGNGALAAAYALVGDQANTRLYAEKFKVLTKGVSNRRRVELFGVPSNSPHRLADGLRIALGDSDG
jgi:DNA-binding winged helix-turn-helix (wHTH) protein/TolB-like protein